ncbi:MAG: RNA polymerase sigma factor region1.1 domain-containing protein [Acidobacteriota bacterium]|nr:RNA polymerase sigma factor region1.1 domain-containing protein [Acidobacteriota bacterium]
METNSDEINLRRLINIGKDRGYITYQELNENLSDEIASSEEIDDLLQLFEDLNIKVVNEQTMPNVEFAEEQDLEKEVHFWEENVEEKERQVSDLSVVIQELKTKLSIFEGEYNARVGVLYVKLDKVNLSIKEYELRFEFAKERKLTHVVQDIEDDVRDTFLEEREKINNLEDETSESSKEYKQHLEKEEQARLDEESKQELKRLYRELAKKYHPDRSIDRKQSEDYHKIMAEINDAYRAKDIERLRSFAERAEREDKIAKETLEEKLDRLKHDDAVLSGIIAKLEAEFRSLKLSGTHKLMKKVQLAKERGHDLLQQLAAKLKSQIAESQVRLDTLIAEYKELAKNLS